MLSMVSNKLGKAFIRDNMSLVASLVTVVAVIGFFKAGLGYGGIGVA